MKSGLYDDIVGGDSKPTGSGLYDDIVAPSKQVRQPPTLKGTLPYNPGTPSANGLPYKMLDVNEGMPPPKPYQFDWNAAAKSAKLPGDNVSHTARIGQLLSAYASLQNSGLESLISGLGNRLSAMGIGNTMNSPEGMEDMKFMSYINPTLAVAQAPGQIGGLIGSAIDQGPVAAGKGLVGAVNFLDPAIDPKERVKRLYMAYLAAHGAVEGVRALGDARLSKGLQTDFPRESGVNTADAVRTAREGIRDANVAANPVKGRIKNVVQNVYHPDLPAEASNAAVDQVVNSGVSGTTARLNELDQMLAKIGAKDRGQSVSDNHPTDNHPQIPMYTPKTTGELVDEFNARNAEGQASEPTAANIEARAKAGVTQPPDEGGAVPPSWNDFLQGHARRIMQSDLNDLDNLRQSHDMAAAAGPDAFAKYGLHRDTLNEITRLKKSVQSHLDNGTVPDDVTNRLKNDESALADAYRRQYGVDPQIFDDSGPTPPEPTVIPPVPKATRGKKVKAQTEPHVNNPPIQVVEEPDAVTPISQTPQPESVAAPQVADIAARPVTNDSLGTEPRGGELEKPISTLPKARAQSPEQSPQAFIPPENLTPTEPQAAYNGTSEPVGISNARNKEAVERGSLPQMPEKGPVQSAGKLAAETKGTTFEDGQKLAADIRAHSENPDAAYSAHSVSRVKAATADFEARTNAFYDKAKAAYDAGRTTEGDKLTQQLEEHQDAGYKMADDLKKGATMWHNIGQAFQGAIDLDTGNWVRVLQDATVKKGSKLSPEVAKTLTDKAKQIQAIREGNAPAPRSVEEVRAERTDILNQLKQRSLFESDKGVPKSREGGAVSAPTLDKQTVKLINDLAKNLKEEFFDLPLDKIVKKISERLPNLKEEDIMSALLSKATRGDKELTPLERANEYHRNKLDKEIRGIIRDQTPKSKLEKAANVRRTAILTSPKPTLKILGSTIGRFADAPVSEAVGMALRKLPVVKDVFAKSPHEGYGSWKAEVDAITKGVPHGVREAVQQTFNGYGELQAKYDLPSHGAGFQGFISRVLHDVPKTPAVVSDYYRRVASSYAKMYAENPEALKDPAVQDMLNGEAWTYAQRTKYRAPNAINDAINAAANKGGALGKAGKTLAVPFGEIPTNIAFEKIERKFGVPLAIAKTGDILKRGMESVPPETQGYLKRTAEAWNKGLQTVTPQEADLIARLYKRGSVGAAKRALGYYAAGHIIGQYYEEHQKNNPKGEPKEGMKYGDLELFGAHIPHWIAEHVPALTDFLDGAHARIRQQAGIGAGTAWAETVKQDLMDVPAVTFTVNGADSVRKGTEAQDITRMVIPNVARQIAGAVDEYHNPTGRPLADLLNSPGPARRAINAKEEAKLAVPNLFGMAKGYTRESIPPTDAGMQKSYQMRAEKREVKQIQRNKQREEQR